MVAESSRALVRADIWVGQGVREWSPRFHRPGSGTAPHRVIGDTATRWGTTRARPVERPGSSPDEVYGRLDPPPRPTPHHGRIVITARDGDDDWFTGHMRHGVEITAYLVNESRARCPDLARDPLAREWIPPGERDAVRALWDEFAQTVYPHDDLVVSLRGRYVLEVLEEALKRDPDTLLVVCGTGFSSYQWLLPFHSGVEVDLPEILEVKRRRAAELVAAGVLPERDITYIPADFADSAARDALVERVRALAAGRPVAYVAEGVVFYLPGDSARAMARLGALFADRALSVITYWPSAARDNQVLAAQRGWFRTHRVPEEASYLSAEDFTAKADERMENLDPEQLQQRYLGTMVVPERHLVPEHIMVVYR